MVSSRPPSTPVEIELAKAWRNILNIEKIDLDSKFFEIGGHSLMLIELNKTIRINMGMEIPLSYYYSYSLEDIARILGEYIRKTAGN
ncbi:MAG: phosphopantetheine-binding protein [Rikenellaceae bacterium]|nr:phosphopantetheine-binding protein [Rikenellaceae bacterium]